MLKNKKSSALWILKNSKRVMPAVALLTLIGVGVSYVSVRFAVASMNLLDAAMGKNSLGFSNCIWGIVGLLIVDLLLQVSYTVYDIRVRTKYRHHLQRRLFKTVLTRSFPEIGKFHSGELVNRLVSDVEIINSNVVDVVPGTVMLISGIGFSFYEMIKLDPYLAAICLGLGPFVLLSATLYGRKMKGLYKKCRQSDGKIQSFMQECIQNIIALKAFCKENMAAKHADGLRKENYRLNMKRGYINIAANVMYYVALTAAYYLAVAWCAYKISIGIMTVGAFTAIIQLVGSIQSPFKDLSAVIPKFYSACASAERIMEVEEAVGEDYSEILEDAGNFEGISAKDLVFAYEDEHILNKANLEIRKGETLVIHGMSGIGKSTFFKILLGVIPLSDGEVKIRFDRKEVSPCVATRGVFSYVPQGNMLISGTIKENIAFFDEIDEERIKQASDLACVSEFAGQLPLGLDTIIGEKGTGLSEGQIQRIAIARAFYSDAQVMLLDEATSALDEATELKILENIRKLDGKTCIIITHRRAAFEMCDRKIRIDDAKFIED